MNLKKCSKWISVAVFFLFSMAALGNASEFPYASIGHVHALHFQGNAASGGAATGVLLNTSGLFLTNIHVISPCFQTLGEENPLIPSKNVIGKKCDAETLWIDFPEATGKPKVLGATIIATGAGSPAADWALLQIDNQNLSNIPTPKINLSPIKPGDTIRFAGFPALPTAKPLDAPAGLYLSTGQFLSAGVVENIFKEIYQSLNLPTEQYSNLLAYAEPLLKSSNQFYYNALICGGFSGGPAFNDNGELVGIVWGNLSTWDFRYGPYPKQIGYDNQDPSKLANSLSTGVTISSICEESKMCP
jgi:S1-C subfamily serine protease